MENIFQAKNTFPTTLYFMKKPRKHRASSDIRSRSQKHLTNKKQQLTLARLSEKYLPLYDAGIILREKSVQAIARMQWNTYDD
ncbi:hypothetical protein [Photobacterium indicum]|uniref:hypothetical protein n=1 Tax=Photobacterium indicum TaxID=81447 RepID=UPI003D0B07A4